MSSDREGSFPFTDETPTGAAVPRLGDRSAPWRSISLTAFAGVKRVVELVEADNVLDRAARR